METVSKKDWAIDSLIIETTRNCNFECGHCLRGPAQKKNMKMEYIKAVFSGVRYIGTVTLSGGEPGLVPHILKKIRLKAKEMDVEIGNFYIATNGSVNTMEFLIEIMNWYDFCTENEISAVELSNDEFHQDEYFSVTGDYANLDKLLIGKLKFTNDRDSKGNKKWLKQGNMTYGVSPNTTEIVIDGDFIEGSLYLNVHGDLIGGCDWSYENQPEHVVGTVKNGVFDLKDCTERT